MRHDKSILTLNNNTTVTSSDMWGELWSWLDVGDVLPTRWRLSHVENGLRIFEETADNGHKTDATFVRDTPCFKARFSKRMTVFASRKYEV